MRRSSIVAAQIAALGFLTLACVTRQPVDDPQVRGLDRKLSTHAYIEEGKLVTLIVDTLPARDRDGNPYMPLEVAVANKGLRQLTLTRESFTLVDDQRRRYPAAGPRELLERYEHLDFDRELAELDTIIFNKFAAYARYPSNFSPARRFENVGLVRDLVVLPKFGYMVDFLYFPTPPGGIRDRNFELFLDSPDLADPVFVKFAVR